MAEKKQYYVDKWDELALMLDPERARKVRAAVAKEAKEAKEENINKSLTSSGLKDGGMVKSKNSGVRGAGCAARGHGKMKVY